MGCKCSIYHNDMDYKDKDEQYAKFLSGENIVLIATDTMARGIDVPAVALVVNYDLPIENDATDQMVISPITYVHRTGRAGRFGRTYLAASILSEEKDVWNMKKIRQYVCNRSKRDPFQDVTANTLEDVVRRWLYNKTTEVEK